MTGNGTRAGDAAGPAKPRTQPLTPVARRRSVRFKGADVVRVIKAAQKAKLQIAVVKIEPDGTILIIPGTPEIVPSSERNPWDDAP